ncbi:NAD(P)H-binding protein [Nocardia pneumoniae]|uniref:NAD(P)H-binding protein n=1 Tax=Nocardia pneumoniae TaxID=228601 RepID=UPI000316AD2F|nr:NAD(P)H-binding protein [Nocardia pneumoniae]
MYVVMGGIAAIGCPLVDALFVADRHVRAVSRQPGAGFLDEVEVVSPETVQAAVSGVESVFVHPRASKDHVSELLRRAVIFGVGQVVAMSASSADDEPAHQPSRHNGDRNTEVEQALVASGLPWVSVRPSPFAMNTVAMWRKQVAAGDTIFDPYASITGPEAVSLERMVAVIGAVIGRPLRYQHIPPEAAARAMIEHGLGERFVLALMDRYARELDRTLTVTDEVDAILGHPACSFATWSADHREEWT